MGNWKNKWFLHQGNNSHLALKSDLLKAFEELGAFQIQGTCLLAWPCNKSFCTPTPDVWFVSFHLHSAHELVFHSNNFRWFFQKKESSSRLGEYLRARGSREKTFPKTSYKYFLNCFDNSFFVDIFLFTIAILSFVHKSSLGKENSFLICLWASTIKCISMSPDLCCCSVAKSCLTLWDPIGQ